MIFVLIVYDIKLYSKPQELRVVTVAVCYKLLKLKYAYHVFTHEVTKSGNFAEKKEAIDLLLIDTGVNHYKFKLNEGVKERCCVLLFKSINTDRLQWKCVNIRGLNWGLEVRDLIGDNDSARLDLFAIYWYIII